MAFINKSNDTPCYSCSRQCINTEFCSEGNSVNIDAISSLSYSLSRNIRVSITANPEFWGFSGVLISGWATYTNGYYDFFDGYDEDHLADRECFNEAYNISSLHNEQRPDVFYRSVYDPDTGITKHYGSNGSFQGSGIGAGGAEVYLIDRPKGLIASVTSDKKSCPEIEPHQIFRQFPENFGWGNKINFNTSVYRNMSSAWRLTSVENCYDSSDLYDPPGHLVDCSGEEKQNIVYKTNRYENYDPGRIRGSGESSYYNYASGCLPDGAVAGKYSGFFTEANSIYRSSDFIHAKLSYGNYDNPLAASGLKNGMTIGIKNDVSGIFNNVYTIFDVQHYTTYTDVKFVGTSTGNAPLVNSIPTGNFSVNIGTLGHWIAFNTYDEQTCCGLAAYGISTDNKNISSDLNYHTDFRKVFNNPKNLRQSNRDRDWRYNYDLFNSIQLASPEFSGASIDYSYPSVSGVVISGVEYGYPIIVSGDAYIVATGDNLINSGSPLFEKEKSYYGNFFETDKYDDAKRFDQKINRGKSNNATCYSKHATLEIFPDCITQYDSYDDCAEGLELYVTNRLARLAFVYRGCDFNDNCSFDDDGLPLGGWKDQGSVPTNINDLKRQLAGQELHMFINLSDAWGGLLPNQPCPCDCDSPGDGYEEPRHIRIPTPLAYPHFPNFDLNPTGYGCLDGRHQISDIMSKLGSGAIEPTEYCDPLLTNPYTCMVRQPYVTYGYIMNLCGKESRNRKNVITEAFAKLHQSKTYTNANPSVDIDEPMYWNIEAPSPAPIYGGGEWGSGTLERADGAGRFIQTAGSGYGYWGLADSNNQLVAPYFTTQNGTNICCDTTGNYIDFSRSGTFQNVLNTHNGWPTEAVPFLIELEVEESCIGCVTKQMEKKTLNLELEGLDTQFIWDQRRDGASSFTEYGQYGHNYCKYGSTIQNQPAFGKAKTDGSLLPYSCESGQQYGACDDTGESYAQYAGYYQGNTCQCINNQNITLHPVTISGADDLVIGWTSNPSGNAAGLIEITGCNDLASSYMDVGYDSVGAGGYRIFGQFDLTCPSMFTYLSAPEYPDAKYEGSPLTQLYGVSCGHHYPASSEDDLQLRGKFYLIAEKHLNSFKLLAPRALRYLTQYNLLGNDIIYPVLENNFIAYFGLCPGDKFYKWGCKPEGTYFYGCDDGAAGQYGGYDICENATLCNTCPTGYGEGEVTCNDCGTAIGYEGIIPRPIPLEYQFNDCDCLCKEPYLISEHVVTQLGPTLTEIVSGEYADCATQYWLSAKGSEPLTLGMGPPQPYMGIMLGGGFSVDWHRWNHGVNGLSSGIKHELWRPYLGVDLPSNLECPQLTIDIGNGAIECAPNTGCALNEDINTKTCGKPIVPGTGSIEDGVIVRKLRCHPEAAIVNKIECIGGNYKLYISREYHEHDRTWQEKIIIGSGETEQSICIPINAGGYTYDDGQTSGCVILPYAVLADSATPVSNAPCSINPSSGLYTQDYEYKSAGFPSGSYIWNYFNIFYTPSFLPSLDNGYLVPSLGIDESGEYQCDTGVFPPRTIVDNSSIFQPEDYNSPVGFNGIFSTTGTHSCVQDAIQCGGELWCNKLFFPRQKYLEGTKVARFGGSQICTANQDIASDINFIGYTEQKAASEVGGRTSFIIPEAKGLLNEMKSIFVDFCDDGNLAEILADVGIDDNYIIVDDYLPLLGVVHPGWRFTSDVKSCTFGGSGCQDSVPVHTDTSIFNGFHQPKTWTQNGFESMGYYLDREGVSYKDGSLVSASGADQCLFSPFKILLDVECNTNRIARKGFPNDDPTYLQGVMNVDARTCLGIVSSPGCGCDATQCTYATASKPGYCQSFTVGEYIATISTDASGECLQGEQPHGGWYHPNVIGGAAPTRTCNGGESPGDWRVIDCGAGNQAIRVGPTSIVKAWQCKENQYLSKHPNEYGGGGPFTECDCLGSYTEGLCSASYVCEDYSSCDCNPVGSGSLDITPPTGTLADNTWWSSDCECDKIPKDDYGSSTYCTPSLVKFTITE